MLANYTNGGMHMLKRNFGRTVSCLLIVIIFCGLNCIPVNVKAAESIAVTGLKLSIGSKKVTKKTYSMSVGNSKNLKVTAKPAEAASLAVFSSSDTSVATVDEAGKITALRPGTAKITVTISSSKYKKTTAWFKVKVKTPDYYKVSATGNEIYDGERRETEFNVKYAECLGLEFWSEGELSVEFPAEGVIIRSILVKNTSSVSRGFGIRDIVDDSFSGSFLKYVRQFGSTTHPNGASFVPLAPGEEIMVEINASPDNSLNDGKTHNLSGDLTIKVPFEVFENEVARPVSVQVELKHKVTYLSKDILRTEKYKTATVKGTVLDPFGNPVSGAKVRLASRIADETQELITGKDGKYEFKIYPYKSAFSGAWREASLYVSADGYIDKGVIVYPKTGKTTTIDPTLFYRENEYTYEQTAAVDIGIQGYEYDTDNKSIAVFVPFHTGLPYEQIADRLKITATDFDGKVLFTYDLPQEIPYVDVSSDGKYTVALVNKGGLDEGYSIVILNKSGKKVYSTDDTDLPTVEKFGVTSDPRKSITRCAALSPDGNYLLASSAGGYVWYIDWKNNKVLWTDYLYGQIRNIKFSADGSEVYISSGTGYLYAFGSSGSLKWKTFIHSWATKMEITDKYVIAATKNAGDNVTCIKRKTGKIQWTYPEQQGAAMGFSVSPDEKYIWIGFFASTAYNSNSSSVYDLATGRIVSTYDMVVAMGGEYTKDGKLFVTKDRNSFTVYNAKSGEKLYSDRIAEQDDYSGCFAITANTDGSKVIVSMNTDTEHSYYGKTYYYKLKGKKKIK